MCADTCQELGVLEAEMHQTVREKFIDPKEKFLKQDLKDGASRVCCRERFNRQERRACESYEAVRWRGRGGGVYSVAAVGGGQERAPGPGQPEAQARQLARCREEGALPGEGTPRLAEKKRT